jgi:hypothetical protein
LSNDQGVVFASRRASRSNLSPREETYALLIIVLE